MPVERNYENFYEILKYASFVVSHKIRPEADFYGNEKSHGGTNRKHTPKNNSKEVRQHFMVLPEFNNDYWCFV